MHRPTGPLRGLSEHSKQAALLRRLLPKGVLLLTLLVSLGCNGSLTGRSEPVTLRMAGSTSMRPVLEDLAEQYHATHPNVLFDIQGGGSELGLQNLLAGKVDIAAVSWKGGSEPDERGIQAVPIARDGLVILIHPSNRVRGLTLLQLRALYRGEMLDWAALNGPAEEPVIISREAGSGDRQAFEALVMGDDRVTLNARVMPTAQAVADYVARHPAAVGYTSVDQVHDGVRALPIEEIAPDSEQIQAGSYHLGRLLYLYVNESPAPDVRDFLNFVLSPAGQAIVAQHHVVLRE